jgi:Leucine-rich repeat (LRR) protein
LPEELRALSSLSDLQLQNNELAGKLPLGLGGLSTLTSLDLSFNKFTFGFPTTWKGMIQLEVLKLVQSGLDGSVADISAFTKLRELDLSQNVFTGTIDFINAMGQLETLVLSGNRFIGTIPSQITNLQYLQRFEVADAGLTGVIPLGFSTLGQLSKFKPWIDFHLLIYIDSYISVSPVYSKPRRCRFLLGGAFW